MNYNYTSILSELQTQLSLMSNWTTTLYYGVYSNLLSVIAYALNKDAYLAYFLYKEANWFTAEKEASLVGMSTMLSYSPYRKQGATGTILMSGSSSFSPTYVYQGSNIFIPKWTSFSNKSKSVSVYCSNFTTYYTNTVGSISIPVKEGTPKQYTYIAQGIINEQIYLYSDKIDNAGMDIYEVDINGNIISQVTITDNLYFISDPSNYYCTISNSPNFDFVYLTFGDSIHTKQLQVGTRILIKYAETLGDSGNINNTGIITKINDVLYDNNSNVVTSIMYVNNTSLISGGTAYEDIESIRNNAPNLFGAGYRCGTITDWISVISSISYVNKNNVWSINDVGGSTLISDQNKVFVTAIGSDGNEITSDQKILLTETLQNDYSSPTELIEYVSPRKLYVVFNVDATINTSTPSIVENQIKEIIYNNYSTINSSFARKIYQSEYVSLISTLPSIVFHETQARFMEYNLGPIQSSTLFNGYYDSTDLSSQVKVTVNSPQLWIKRKINSVWQAPVQLAYSSGSLFIGLPNPWNSNIIWDLTATNINYTTYTYSYIINTLINDILHVYGVNNPSDTDLNGYIITLVYSTENGNAEQQESIRLYQRNQITDIDSDYIFVAITEQ